MSTPRRKRGPGASGGGRSQTCRGIELSRSVAKVFSHRKRAILVCLELSCWQLFLPSSPKSSSLFRISVHLRAGGSDPDPYIAMEGKVAAPATTLRLYCTDQTLPPQKQSQRSKAGNKSQFVNTYMDDRDEPTLPIPPSTRHALSAERNARPCPCCSAAFCAHDHTVCAGVSHARPNALKRRMQIASHRTEALRKDRIKQPHRQH